MDAVADNLVSVRSRIARAGGDPDRTTIVAVTKGQPLSACRSALTAGLRDLGENYAQELDAKATTCPVAARWHFLGAVQRNKIRRLAPFVYLWQGIDDVEVGRSIARSAPGARVLVEVNLSGLPGRGGCSWDEAAELAERLDALGLRVRGVMGIGDQTDPRPGFHRLGALAGRLGVGVVSMGMSSDFEIAVQEGATMIRLGTALFGPRPARKNLRR